LAHLEINCFISSFINYIDCLYKNSNVLEIGSYDVNGSIRANFNFHSKYTGVDLIPGPSVDVVSKGHLFKSSKRFDIILSIESFEHNIYWKETFLNMINLCSDDGIIIFTCATKGRLEHGTYRTDPISSPGTSLKDNSYYFNLTRKDFEEAFNFKEHFVTYNFYVNNLTKDLYFFGLKSNKKISEEKALKIFDEAINNSIAIRKKIHLLSYYLLRIFYFMLCPFYTYLSERAYQNVTYLPYKKLKAIISKISRV